MIHTMEILIENVRPYELWSYIEDLKKCKSYCFQTEYKGINIKYYMTSRTLILVVDVLDIMQKDKVCVSDFTEFKIKMEQIVYELIGRKNAKLKCNRCDYFVDLYYSDEILNIVKEDLLHKHLHQFKYMSMKQIYSSSLAVRTKYGKTNISLYDKEKERIDRFDFVGAQKYKGCFRIELQTKKRAIKKAVEQNIMSQNIEDWWSKKAFLLNFGVIMLGYLYNADYWQISYARQKIRNSELKDIYKSRLCIFITKANAVGLSNIKKYYSPSTVTRYINQLIEIGINPICIEDNRNIVCIQSIFSRCMEIAKKEYFK